MIKRSEELQSLDRFDLFGGKGNAKTKHLISPDDFEGTGRLFGTITLEPGASIGFHKHENEQETFYVLEGQAIYSDDGTEYVLNTGDVAFCKSGHGHSIACSGDKTMVVAALITFVK